MVVGPPALMKKSGFDSIRERYERLEARLKVKENQFCVEFQAEGVTEGRLNRETSEIVAMREYKTLIENAGLLHASGTRTGHQANP